MIPVKIHSVTSLCRSTLTALALVLPWTCLAEDKPTGPAVYQAKCASCHGAKGEGVQSSYPHPLIGDRSVGELIEYIAKSMPQDKPGSCVGEEAEVVSRYIYGEFYSPTAQVRHQPARIELQRLTVRQYRNAIADLVNSFRWNPENDTRQGLKGYYLKSRNVWAKEVAIERLDPVIAFDFGDKAPDPDKLEPHEFAIRWEGSVFAPDTGEYEFVIRSDQSTKLFLNNHKHPLVDAYVKSGTDKEHKATVFLLGGRLYPVRLEFSKTHQGVKDQKVKEKPPEPASISLEWKRPHRINEVIPARFLSPVRPPELCVVATNFPPDDRSKGWESASSISKEWDEATTEAALEVADYIEANIDQLTNSKPDAGDRTERLKDFSRKFADRAFRRPLDEEQRKLYIDQQFEKAGNNAAALKRIVLMTLKSPRFLYREVTSGSTPGNDPYDVASRMSFGLWDSIPNQQLLEAAARNQLSNRQQVADIAQQMVNDPRCRSKMREFLLKWLKIERVPSMSKDPEVYPDFDATVADDLRTSLELFLDDLLSSEAGDFQQLLLSDDVYLNGRLAKFYGAVLPEDAPFQKVTLESSERAGVLSHPYLLSDFAYTGSSSPIHRGIFIARSVLGRALRPPPEAVVPLSEKLEPNLTTRERVAMQTRADFCQSCHSMINSLGFTLEHFDAVGRFRTVDSGKPVDSKGEYRTRSGEIIEFQGLSDLANYLAGSTETHDAFVEQVFHGMIKQPIRAYGPQVKEQLRQKFVANKFNLRRLLVEIIVVSALKPAEANVQAVIQPNAAATGTGG